MRAYLAIKFHEDMSNRQLIEQLALHLSLQGIETSIMVRDHERWGEKQFPPGELMKITFEEINICDLLIVETTEKGVGLGIEAGYAYAKGIPIIVIAKEGADISQTLRGVAHKVISYKDPEEVVINLSDLAQ